VTEADGEPVKRSRSFAHSLGAAFFRFSPPPLSGVDVALDEIDDSRLVEMLWNTEVGGDGERLVTRMWEDS
jgi:hypothetical protein